jgi:hypothetical protein
MQELKASMSRSDLQKQQEIDLLSLQIAKLQTQKKQEIQQLAEQLTQEQVNNNDEVKSLKIRLSCSLDENTQLSQQLTQVQQLEQELQQRLKLSLRDIEMLKQTTSAVRHDKEVNASRDNQLQSLLDEQTQRVEEMTAQDKLLREEKLSLQSDLQFKSNEVAQLQRERESLLHEVLMWKERVTVSNEKLSTAVEAVEKDQRQATILREQIAKSEVSAAQLQAIQKEQLSMKEKILLKEVNEQHLQQQLILTQDMLQQANQDKEKLIETFKFSSTNSENKNIYSNDESSERIQQELTECKAQLQQRTQEHQLLEIDNRRLTALLAMKDNLSEELSSKDNELRIVQVKFSTLEAEKQSFEETMQSRQSEIGSLRSRLSELETEAMRLRTFEIQVQSLQQALVERDKEMLKLRTELSTETSSSSLQAASLKNRLTELAAKNEEVQSLHEFLATQRFENEQTLKDVFKLRSELSQSQQAHEIDQNRLKMVELELSHVNDMLSSQRNLERSTLTSREQDIESLRSRIRELERENSAAQQEVQMIQQHSDRSNEELESLQSQLITERETSAQKDKKIKSFREELLQLQKRMSEQQSQGQVLRSLEFSIGVQTDMSSQERAVEHICEKPKPSCQSISVQFSPTLRNSSVQTISVHEEIIKSPQSSTALESAMVREIRAELEERRSESAALFALLKNQDNNFTKVLEQQKASRAEIVREITGTLAGREKQTNDALIRDKDRDREERQRVEEDRKRDTEINRCHEKEYLIRPRNNNSIFTASDNTNVKVYKERAEKGRWPHHRRDEHALYDCYNHKNEDLFHDEINGEDDDGLDAEISEGFEGQSSDDLKSLSDLRSTTKALQNFSGDKFLQSMSKLFSSLTSAMYMLRLRNMKGDRLVNKAIDMSISENAIRQFQIREEHEMEFIKCLVAVLSKGKAFVRNGRSEIEKLKSRWKKGNHERGDPSMDKESINTLSSDLNTIIRFVRTVQESLQERNDLLKDTKHKLSTIRKSNSIDKVIVVREKFALLDNDLHKLSEEIGALVQPMLSSQMPIMTTTSIPPIAMLPIQQTSSQVPVSISMPMAMSMPIPHPRFQNFVSAGIENIFPSQMATAGVANTTITPNWQNILQKQSTSTTLSKAVPMRDYNNRINEIQRQLTTAQIQQLDSWIECDKHVK